KGQAGLHELATGREFRVSGHDMAPCTMSSENLSETLIHQLLESDESGYRLLVVERQVLHQQHRADAGCGVDPKLGVEDAGPAQAARRALVRIRVLAGDLKAEPETVASGAERECPG